MLQWHRIFFPLVLLNAICHAAKAPTINKHCTFGGGLCVARNETCPFKNSMTWTAGCARHEKCCHKFETFRNRISEDLVKCGKAPTLSTGVIAKFRIRRGRPAQPGEIPWQVAVWKNSVFHCAGVILSDRWILSAAHCFKLGHDFGYFTVSVGLLKIKNANDVKHHEIKKIVTHASFNRPVYANDIAVLKLREPLQFDNSTRPICLPWSDMNLENLSCEVSGWGWNGRSSGDHLVVLEVPINPIDECKKDPINGKWVYDSNICAGLLKGLGSPCKGDSGGPLSCRLPSGPWVLAGLVSWGEGCVLSNRPTMYSRVSAFLEWIEKETGEVPTIPKALIENRTKMVKRAAERNGSGAKHKNLLLLLFPVWLRMII